MRECQRRSEWLAGRVHVRRQELEHVVGGGAEGTQARECRNLPAGYDPTGLVVTRGKVAPHVVLLLVNILPIVILAKSLGKVIDYGIDASGAPHALSGIIIATLVFTPEGLSALNAIRGDQLTRAINLCLGSVASTLGLTVPAVLAIGIYTRHTVILGLPPSSIVLLVATLILSALTFTGSRTTMLEGAVHLSMFAVFLVLVFSP